MKRNVDAALCAGHGQCHLTAPDVFELDDEGFVVDAGETVEVPEGHESEARDAAAACPESAILVTD